MCKLISVGRAFTVKQEVCNVCKLISVGRAFIRQDALIERGRLVRLFTVRV